MTKFQRLIDNVFFNGAEQKTNAAQYNAEVEEYIESYTGPIEVSAGYQGVGYYGTCDRCGGSAAVNTSSIPGGFTLCESCTNKKVEQNGYDPNGLPWNQWKSGRKPPVRLG